MRNHDELERLFAPHGAHGRFEPNTDVHLDEESGAFVVHVELAGADADSLRVYVDDVYLSIAGVRASRAVSRKASLLRKEIQSGEFAQAHRVAGAGGRGGRQRGLSRRHPHDPASARPTHEISDRADADPHDGQKDPSLMAKPDKAPEILGILPLQDAVLFPNTVIPLAVVKRPGIQLVEEALREGKQIGLVVLKDKETEDPGPDDLRRFGTIGTIQKMLKVPDGTLRCIVAGGPVFRIDQFVASEPYLAATYTEMPDITRENDALVAMQRNLGSLFQKLLGYLPQAPREMEMEVNNISDPNLLSYFVASTMRLETADRQAILEERDTGKRLRRLTMLITKELEVVELGHKIQSDIQREMEKNQRDFYLRQQMRAIQEELGEGDPQQAEAAELRKKIDDANMPEDVKKSADRELDRLAKVPQASPEYSVIRTYLDWLVQLPWSISTSDQIDIARARAILDEDHYDLEKIKDRIVEYLAVGKLKNKLTGPILCFVGPPGVGKTSLGQSIAKAMGRKFVRLSVGGVRDEAEIRGHRRTYIGAMPGTIVRALRDAGTNNPVIMIDEIDKVGGDYRGDPQSALLEVLDPEQNNSFRDHYLDLPFDLSRVLFICTANTLDSISGAAARPHGDHPALGLHRAREDADRQAVSGRQAEESQRPQREPGRDRRHGAQGRHRRLHARGRGAQPRARDRHDLPQGRAQGRRGRQVQGADQAREPGRLPLEAALLQRGQAAHRRRSASRRACSTRRSAATSSSSRRAPCRAAGSSRSPVSSAT